MSNRVALDAAAFMDSPQAASLERADAQKIVQLFLQTCYDDLGKAPHLLDGQDLHEILGHRLPGRFAQKDPLAENVPTVLEAFFDHLENRAVVTHAFEIRQSLLETTPEFLSAVRSGKTAHHHGPSPKPVVNKAPKTGRNDPCFCGSGLKFKKCHGKR